MSSPSEQRAAAERVVAAICPSCDDHGGYGRQWSVWVDGVRLTHGIARSEAEAVVDDLLTREREARRLEREWWIRELNLRCPNGTAVCHCGYSIDVNRRARAKEKGDE